MKKKKAQRLSERFRNFRAAYQSKRASRFFRWLIILLSLSLGRFGRWIVKIDSSVKIRSESNGVRSHFPFIAKSSRPWFNPWNRLTRYPRVPSPFRASKPTRSSGNWFSAKLRGPTGAIIARGARNFQLAKLSAYMPAVLDRRRNPISPLRFFVLIALFVFPIGKLARSIKTKQALKTRNFPSNST